ncbi:MAG: helix-turn-helix transcriptional regulator [Rhodospirillales bacterium]|nr:helix-turn-helix transcriptional regulator [Rhodospirillales bacterium]
MPEAMPITPEVMTWAREHAGFSIDTAAADFPKIAQWEAGKVFPSYPQLEKMAKTFKVPVAVFFFPEPADLPHRKNLPHAWTRTDRGDTAAHTLGCRLAGVGEGSTRSVSNAECGRGRFCQTEPLDMPDRSHDAMVSSGVFTCGHIGREPFDELVRVPRPNGFFSFPIHVDIREARGFEGSS